MTQHELNPIRQAQFLKIAKYNKAILNLFANYLFAMYPRFLRGKKSITLMHITTVHYVIIFHQNYHIGSTYIPLTSTFFSCFNVEIMNAAYVCVNLYNDVVYRVLYLLSANDDVVTCLQILYGIIWWFTFIYGM